MRLLRVKDLTFTEDLPETDHLPYAILSHTRVNSKEEVAYEDILKGDLTKPGAQKLRFAVEQCLKNDLQFFWDTCCINREDNEELTRSINSLYRWFGKSAKCYVYLKGDVHGDRDMGNDWFTRVWTVQELLGPKVVEFYNEDGFIGTKVTLKEYIFNYTWLTGDVLTGVDCPINDRMGWNSKLKAKRGEDMAYSMIGILDASMSIQYGEGRHRASLRLVNAMWRRYEELTSDCTTVEAAEALSPKNRVHRV